MEVYIPSFRYEESDLERGYTVGAVRGRTGPREPGPRPVSPGGAPGRRRPAQGVPRALPSPVAEEGLRPGAVVKETCTPPGRGGCTRPGSPDSFPFPSLPRSGSGGAGATAVESPVAALAFLPPPAVCSLGCAALVSGTSAPNAQTVVASGRVDVGSKFYGILSDG